MSLRLRLCAALLVWLVATACGSGMASMLSSGNKQQHSIAVAELMPNLGTMQQSAIDPFNNTPVTWNSIGIEQVDSFSHSTASVYGRALVLQQTLDQIISWRSNPSLSVAGYRDANELVTIASQLASETPDEVSRLLTAGGSLLTSLPTLVTSSDLRLVPVATEEVQAGLQRLNTAQRLLRDQSTRLSSVVTGN